MQTEMAKKDPKAMSTFNSTSVKELMEFNKKPCVSIFLPAAEKGAGTLQPPIRLKNLLARAWDDLIGKYPESQRAMAEVFKQADALVDNKVLWQHQKQGFALFMGPDWLRHYSFGISLKDRWTVGGNFNIKPVLPLFTDKSRCYLLALSQKTVRFFEVVGQQMTELELPDVMQSIEELQKYDIREKQLQVYAMPPVGARGGGVAHGHATDYDGKEMKKRVSDFVKIVVGGLERYLQTDRTPVLLCGEPFMQHLVSDCHPSFNLMTENISANPTRMEPEQILSRAGEIMDRQTAMQNKRVIDRLAALMDTGWTIQEIDQILPRAEEGRVESLFINPDLPIWGFWNREGGLIQVHEEPAPDDQDLTDIAVVQTLMHGGEVYAVPPGAIKGGAPMAAILRY
jgi:hypothetical protein